MKQDDRRAVVLRAEQALADAPELDTDLFQERFSPEALMSGRASFCRCHGDTVCWHCQLIPKLSKTAMDEPSPTGLGDAVELLSRADEELIADRKRVLAMLREHGALTAKVEALEDALALAWEKIADLEGDVHGRSK